MSTPVGSAPIRISPAVKWTICAVAALGFLVDIYAILVAPLILQPALLELALDLDKAVAEPAQRADARRLARVHCRRADLVEPRDWRGHLRV